MGGEHGKGKGGIKVVSDECLHVSLGRHRGAAWLHVNHMKCQVPTQSKWKEKPLRALHFVVPYPCLSLLCSVSPHVGLAQATHYYELHGVADHK